MAKTMAQAVTAARATTTSKGTPCFVYQFPKGHWSTATAESDVGKRLAATGHVYEGVKAQHFEPFTA